MNMLSTWANSSHLTMADAVRGRDNTFHRDDQVPVELPGQSDHAWLIRWGFPEINDVKRAVLKWYPQPPDKKPGTNASLTKNPCVAIDLSHYCWQFPMNFSHVYFHLQKDE